jgi:hypothetical protein
MAPSFQLPFVSLFVSVHGEELLVVLLHLKLTKLK